VVTVEGPLKLTVHDFPAMMGVSWIAPTAEGAPGAVNAFAVRYGSLCALSVTGRADVSGNRIVLHLVNAMKRLGTRRGIATECIGGGQGGAMLIETV